MMIKYFLLSLLLAFQVSHSALQETESLSLTRALTTLRPLPDRPVATLDEQIDLFVQAYTQAGPDPIHPLETHVPGLIPMIEMHYTYVHQHLLSGSPGSGEKQIDLLRGFWQPTSQMLAEEKITVARMRSIIIQLAFLLSDFHGKPFREWGLPTYVCKTDEGWEENWTNLKTYQYDYFYTDITPPGSYDVENWPLFGQRNFYCEAILCKIDGILPIESFCKAYLDYGFPLNLTALPLEESASAHGGNVSQITRFISHDFDHTNNFATSLRLEEKLKKSIPYFQKNRIWDVWKEMLATLYHKADVSETDREENNLGIFLILHEGPVRFYERDFSWLDEEKIPFLCQRQVFFDLLKTSVEQLMEKLSLIVHRKKLHLDLVVKADRVEDLEGDLSRFHARLGTKTEKDIHQNVATFYFDTNKLDMTTSEQAIKITHVSDTQWNACADHLTDDEKNEMSQKLQDLKKPYYNGGPEYGEIWEYTVREMMGEFNQFVVDYESALRDLGYPVLDSNSHAVARQEAIETNLITFWENFYRRNKDLFSVTPLE